MWCCVCRPTETSFSFAIRTFVTPPHPPVQHFLQGEWCALMAETLDRERAARQARRGEAVSAMAGDEEDGANSPVVGRFRRSVRQGTESPTNGPEFSEMDPEPLFQAPSKVGRLTNFGKTPMAGILLMLQWRDRRV